MGQRVVEGQRLVQSASDIFLGWDSVDRRSTASPRDFYFRQMWDWKLSPDIDTMAPETFEVYAQMCGWVLALGHARSGDAIAIGSYLGAGPRFDESMCRFASSYADQNEHDHEALKLAIATNKVHAISQRVTGPPVHRVPDPGGERQFGLRTTRHHATAQARIDPRRTPRLRLRRQGPAHHPAVPPVPEDEMRPDDAFQAISDELLLDGNARQNLATFCQTWEEDEVHQLMDLSMNKNMIDKDEYPQTAEIERRCVQMLADLWNAPDEGGAVGCSAIGSSEACMLGGMAALWRWRARRKAEGKPTDSPELRVRPGAGRVAQIRPSTGTWRSERSRCRQASTAWTSSRCSPRSTRTPSSWCPPSVSPTPVPTSRWPNWRRLSTPWPSRPGSTWTSTWTAPRARSSPRSVPPTCSGTSASRG